MMRKFTLLGVRLVSVKIHLINNLLSGAVQLNPGTYHNLFHCMLPSGMPPSVETEYGYNRCSGARIVSILLANLKLNCF